MGIIRPLYMGHKKKKPATKGWKDSKVRGGEASYERVSFVHDSGMVFEDTRTGSHAQDLHKTKPVKSTT